jgi:Ca2+-binding EF-hand superfamily protein
VEIYFSPSSFVVYYIFCVNSCEQNKRNMDSNELNRRSLVIDELFTKWDFGGNCSIRFSELLQILQASQRLSNKDQQKWVKRLEFQIEQGRRFNHQVGSTASLSVLSGGVVTFGDATGEPSLDPKAFHQLIMHLTEKDTPEDFDEFVAFCEKSVIEAAESTQGSKLQREIWELFRLLDTNNDGFVDFEELEALIGHQSKKQLIKWKHYLHNKANEIPQTHNHEHLREDSDSDDDEERRSLRLSLGDFQKFVQEYVEKKDEKVGELLAAVRKDLQKKNVDYIVNHKLHEIMNELMEDLLKEKPVDVLAGVVKSVERLKRTKKYEVEKKLKR